MRTGRVVWGSLLAALGLWVGAAGTSWAAGSAGQVTDLRGRVTVASADGDIRSLKKGAPVNEGETIDTGPGAFAKMEFSDGSQMYIRPRSRFFVESYRDTGRAQEDRSFFSLLKGGFRYVTGRIGKANRQAFRMNTPVATIGIRGTDFEGRYCAEDCMDAIGTRMQEPDDGLYVGVTEGTATVTASPEVPVNAGEYYYVSLEGLGQYLAQRPRALNFNYDTATQAGCGAGE